MSGGSDRSVGRRIASGRESRVLKVSVVIPARNDAPMLERALQHLASQLRPADEIVVVDNGSTDDTAAVARASQAAGVVVVDEPVPGIWSASSTGYDAATGDIIVRIDADSRPPVDWLAHIEAIFVTMPEVDAVTGPGEFYDGSAIATLLGRNLYLGGYFWSMSLWLGQPPLFGSNFAMRREVWADARGRVHRTDPRIHDDLDLSIHLAPGTRVHYEDTLAVGISGRPFASWSGFGRRIDWAFHTIGAHLPEEAPWRRRAARRAVEHHDPIEPDGFPV
ncbi:glycosyltransferase family A protein [Plantibacter sp. Mn2098]|uniref:glycosyltransferase family A protein n=1 Tax=Plantibacter sp. Mn2098 TaxID=3395266 RepID=UPI003BCECE11